jgi:hypothetical protein
MKLERVAARSLIHPDKQLENDMAFHASSNVIKPPKGATIAP